MATKKSQRVGLLIITVLMLVGTAGSLAAMGLGVKNASSEQEKYLAEYRKSIEEQQEQQKIAAEFNAQNSEPLEGYSSRVFDADIVEELVVEVLVDGDGEVIEESDMINASYFGWLSDGTIFDSSTKKEAEDQPATFPLTGVISGWTKGIAGKTVGSVLRLTIPADMGYGSGGSGIIPADAPLEFIVRINSIVEAE
jgi:FKBP-type peptidyl-prolyl cis-trans isomerase